MHSSHPPNYSNQLRFLCYDSASWFEAQWGLKLFDLKARNDYLLTPLPGIDYARREVYYLENLGKGA